MPTYYKPGERKGYSFYAVRGWTDGKQHEIRTGTTNKKGIGGAEEFWEHFKIRTRAERGAPPTRQTATFDDAVILYRQNRDLSVSEGRYIARLEKHFSGRLLSTITLGDLHHAARRLYPGCKPQTMNRQAIRPAAAVLHYASKSNFCSWIRVELFEEIDPDRPLIYPEELEVLIEAARNRNDIELEALLTTFQRQGWRVTETITIDRDRIDWHRKSIERWVTKSKRWRKTVIDDDVMALWKRLDKRRNGRLFTYGDRKAVYRAIDALGSDIHFRPHMARRGFATSLNEAGTDTLDIMRSGGWEDPKSVAVYIRDDVEQHRKTIGKIGARLRATRKKVSKISA